MRMTLDAYETPCSLALSSTMKKTLELTLKTGHQEHTNTEVHHFGTPGNKKEANDTETYILFLCFLTFALHEDAAGAAEKSIDW